MAVNKFWIYYVKYGNGTYSWGPLKDLYFYVICKIMEKAVEHEEYLVIQHLIWSLIPKFALWSNISLTGSQTQFFMLELSLSTNLIKNRIFRCTSWIFEAKGEKGGTNKLLSGEGGIQEKFWLLLKFVQVTEVSILHLRA